MSQRLLYTRLFVFPIIREIQGAMGIPELSLFLPGLEDWDFR